VTLPVGAFLLIAAASLIHVQRAEQRPVFRSGIEVVQLDVSVVRNKIPVRGLTADDFIVTDNGVPQVVQSAVVDQLPLSVQLVLDISGSVVGDRLRHLIAAADGLVAALRPDEWAGLLTFSHRLHPLAPMTDDLAAVRRRLAAIAGDGRTALRDGVQFALATDHIAEARPLILVFTDGIDNASWLSDEEVLESARRAGTVIHAVVVAGQQLSPTRFAERLVGTTGGRLWSARSESDLVRLFTDALDEMRARYLLSFAPQRPVRAGWHELKVRLRSGGGNVTARPGYFATP